MLSQAMHLYVLVKAAFDMIYYRYILISVYSYEQ